MAIAEARLGVGVEVGAVTIAVARPAVARASLPAMFMDYDRRRRRRCSRKGGAS